MKNLSSNSILLIKQWIMCSAIVIALSGCSSITNIQQAQINGNKVEFAISGQGEPSVVLETGMGQKFDTWDQIYETLALKTEVYAYNRPGYGNSGLKNAPRTVKEVAQQLRANLQAQQVAPPYILVGHSAGGLYINMFARLYPDEVAGVVFIDASHPEQFEYFRIDHPMLYDMLISSTKMGKRKYERDIVLSCLNSFEEVPDFPDVPISVLTAGKKSSILETKKLRTRWMVFQKDLANLSSDSRHIIVKESGHYIHRKAPDIVVAEILRIKSIFIDK